MTQHTESRVFHHFRSIANIPRCSGDRDRIASFLTGFAEEHGLAYKRDETDNVVIYKPASPGKEDAAPVALQGHTDMVCEKTSSSTHNFDTDPIELIEEGDWLRANNTTLGADNGIAVAMMLAILEDKDAVHPPIEAVFTSDEEIGLIGAHALDPSLMKAKRLINIDSEAEGILWTGCAGGETMEISIPVDYMKVENLQAGVVSVAELAGGHSGMEIHKKRHNAIKVLTEVLNRLKDEVAIGLIRMAGGTKHNAIPRDAEAKIAFSPEDAPAVTEYIEKITEELLEVYREKEFEDEPVIRFEKTDAPARALTLESFEKVLACLTLLPTGVYSMSRQIEGMVQASDNLAIVETGDETVEIVLSIRSSDPKDQDQLRGKVLSVTEIAEAKVDTSGGYPAWEVKEESPLRDTFAEVGRAQFGEMEITAVHAGLETALFADRDPDMDLISLGPDMHEVHTPQERVSIGSTERVYSLIRAVLEQLD